MSQTPIQTPPIEPELKIDRAPDFRVSYANSVQVRMSLWDFELVFGTLHQDRPESIELTNFQGIYLSPQQAKALNDVLTRNLQQYEKTFGKLALEPLVGGQPMPPIPQPGGPVN